MSPLRLLHLRRETSPGQRNWASSLPEKTGRHPAVIPHPQLPWGRRPSGCHRWPRPRPLSRAACWRARKNLVGPDGWELTLQGETQDTSKHTSTVLETDRVMLSTEPPLVRRPAMGTGLVQFLSAKARGHIQCIYGQTHCCGTTGRIVGFGFLGIILVSVSGL